MKNVAPPTSPGRRKSLLTRSAPGGGWGGGGAAEMLPYNTHTRFLHLLGRSASWEGLRVVSQRRQRLLLGSNCAPTPFAGPNSGAALICVSGWKRDLSLPKQRGSKDPRRGPIRHHYCLFRLFRRVFFFVFDFEPMLALPQPGRVVSHYAANGSDHSALCVFQPLFRSNFRLLGHQSRARLARKSFSSSCLRCFSSPTPQPAEPLNQFQVQFKA